MDTLTKINPALTATPSTPAHDPRNEDESTLAARRVAADLDAVADDDLEFVNIDAMWLVTTMLAVGPRVNGYMDAIRALPGSEAAVIAKLGDYTQALSYWQAQTLLATTPTPELAAMVETAIEVRDRTLSDLRALVNHGVLDAAAIEKFVGVNGHRKVAFDLKAMSALVHAEWPRIQGKTMITLEAMDEAAKLAGRILVAVGERDANPVAEAQAQKQRDKAYTLVVRTYAKARRALSYLRFAEGDADTILPSLYAGRGGRRPGKAGAENANAAAPAANAVASASSSAPSGVVYSSMIGAPVAKP